MIIKLFGIIDILIGLSFWIFSTFGFIPWIVIFFFGVFIFVKGFIFFAREKNGISLIDAVAGFIILITADPAITMPIIVVIIVTLYLLQKGIFSLVQC